MKKRFFAAFAAWALMALPSTGWAQDVAAAKAIYDGTCAGCHGTGVLDAPKFGDAAAWGPRAKGGIDALVKSATAGTAKGMPPKGGRADLSPAQLRAVIEYMIAGGKPVAKTAAVAPAAAAVAAAPVTKPPVAAPVEEDKSLY